MAPVSSSWNSQGRMLTPVLYKSLRIPEMNTAFLCRKWIGPTYSDVVLGVDLSKADLPSAQPESTYLAHV